MIRIDWTRDDEDMGTGDDLRLEYRGAPFTGEVVTSHEDRLLSQSFYVDGVQHGVDRKWWMDGQAKSEGEVRNGVPVGVYREWHRNGQLAVEKDFDDNGNLRGVRKWDADGNLVGR